MHPLDDIERIKELDPQDHFGMVAGLADQLPEAYTAGTDVIEDLIGELGGIAVAGMGGSAIGSDLVAAAYDNSLPGPLVTIRGYRLPHWVDSRTLVFAVSYSGNTEESLSCLDQALERGCRVVCICSGGHMADVAAGNGLPIIEVPAGLQPRAAIGYLSMPIASCLESLGLIEGVEGDVSEATALLRELSRLYGPENPTSENPAKRLAMDLRGKIPVIYGCELTTAAARRWKGQINENAKNAAFANEIPELNHNEIVGWENPAGSLGRFAVVFLSDEGVHPQNRRRIEITGGLMEDYAGLVRSCHPGGNSRLTRIFSSIYLGDYVSLYLAILNGVDPSPVDRIEDLKKKLA